MNPLNNNQQTTAAGRTPARRRIAKEHRE